MASLCTLRMRNLPWILQGGGAAGRQFAGIARAARRLGMGGHLDSPYCVCGRGVLRLVGAGCAACEEGLGLAQTREKVGLGDEILRGEERTQPAAKRRLIFRFFGGLQAVPVSSIFHSGLACGKMGCPPERGPREFFAVAAKGRSLFSARRFPRRLRGVYPIPGCAACSGVSAQKTGRRNVPPPGKREESKSVRKAYWARRFSLTFEASLPILSRR